MLVRVEITGIDDLFIYGKYQYKEGSLILDGIYKIDIKTSDVYTDIENPPRVLPCAICHALLEYEDGKADVGWVDHFLYT